MTFATEHITQQIADESVIASIETHSVPIRLDGERWWDTRPMTDAREHCGEVIDMLTRDLAYATERGLVQRSLSQPWLVRIKTTH